VTCFYTTLKRNHFAINALKSVYLHYAFMYNNNTNNNNDDDDDFGILSI